MTIVQIIVLAIKTSMFLMVFALGLHATVAQTTYLFRRPVLLCKASTAMNVIMLLVAIALTLWPDLPRGVKVAILALALSPVPPILPNKQLKAGGSANYTVGLLVGIAVVAVVLVPSVVELLGQRFGVTVHIPTLAVAKIVAVSIVIPLALGVLVRRFASEFADRIMHPVSLIATIMLVAASIPLLFFEAPLLKPLIGTGVLVCLVLFSMSGLAVGHFLGGPDPDNRTVLALATGARHPAIPLAIASVNFPDDTAIVVVVVFHLLVAMILAIPYVKWRMRAHALGARPS